MSIHGKINDERLAIAAANIIMEFIIWTDDKIKRGYFDKKYKASDFWIIIDKEFNIPDCNTMSPMAVDSFTKDDGKEYYFCDRIHLQVNRYSNIKKGTIIKINKLEREKIPYVDEKRIILFYAKENNYKIIKENE